jgi:uncharacterized membrane protein YhhN
MTIPSDLHGDAWPLPHEHALVRLALPAVGVLAAVLAIVSAPWGVDMPWLDYAFKPIATLAVIAWAVARPGDGTAVKRWVLIGLVASLCGDVALEFPQGFLVGLVSFLVGHLAYLVAFTRPVRFGAVPLAFAAYAVVAGGILAELWPGVPAPLHAPVVVYVAALAAMAAQTASVAWRRRREADAPRWFVAAVGGALFVASDSILATNRFGGDVPMSSLWILGTYWAAQWCLASAAAGPAARSHVAAH